MKDKGTTALGSPEIIMPNARIKNYTEFLLDFLFKEVHFEVFAMNEHDISGLAHSDQLHNP